MRFGSGAELFFDAHEITYDTPPLRLRAVQRRCRRQPPLIEFQLCGPH